MIVKYYVMEGVNVFVWEEAGYTSLVSRKCYLLIEVPVLIYPLEPWHGSISFNLNVAMVQGMERWWGNGRNALEWGLATSCFSLLQSEPVHFVLFYILGFHVNPGKTTTKQALWSMSSPEADMWGFMFPSWAEPWGTTFLMLRACDPHAGDGTGTEWSCELC